jgi:hypothetical protein
VQPDGAVDIPGGVVTRAVSEATTLTEHALDVGHGGRAPAEQMLDYRMYPEPLCEFFTAVYAKRIN